MKVKIVESQAKSYFEWVLFVGLVADSTFFNKRVMSKRGVVIPTIKLQSLRIGIILLAFVYF